MNYHIPVLIHEVLEGLRVQTGKRYIDATVGGGGHTKAIAALGATVLGIDTDKEAVEEVKNIKNKGIVVWGNFRDIAEIGQKIGFTHVDGVLFDLGVSSHQIDEGYRGFSYKNENARLDLRLDQTQGITGEDVINRESEQTLITIFETLGEEENGKAIARAIVIARKDKPIKTTGELLTIITGVVGEQSSYSHASRIFQAIRIYVNDELSALKKGLQGAWDLLAPGGRLAVISFHSLEDRIVKQFMKQNNGEIITKKPITATDEEVKNNKRARSAKLRIIQKV